MVVDKATAGGGRGNSRGTHDVGRTREEEVRRLRGKIRPLLTPIGRFATAFSKPDSAKPGELKEKKTNVHDLGPEYRHVCVNSKT
jgi:hypothetical protein